MPDLPDLRPRPARDFSLAIVIAKVALVLAAGLGVIYWAKQQPAAPTSSAVAGPAVKRGPAPAVISAPHAAPASDPAETAATPETPPHGAPEPSALERVLAAAEKSKREAAAAAGPEAAPSSLEDVISGAMPAVVRVETAAGFGSGFFIAADTILTNVHVVGTNASVTIRRLDGKTLPARVETAAAELDIAVLRISTPEAAQPTIKMSAGRPRPGQEVIALGSPLGLQNTVTRGIVSAVRTVGALTLVQTDAAINPGNSGGPLLDRTGQVIGITTMAMRSAVAQGLGFAVAIEHAEALMAGKRGDQKGTPLSTLNEAMSGRPSQAEVDAARDRAAKEFEQAVSGVARRANTLDDRWSAFLRICYQGKVAPVAGHPWYAIWDAHAMQGSVSPGCTSAFSDIQRAADEVRDIVAAAGEAARQSDVYPGTRRDILRRYRLDYAGWDR